MMWYMILVSSLALVYSQDYQQNNNENVIYYNVGGQLIPAHDLIQQTTQRSQQDLDHAMRQPANLIPQPINNVAVNPLKIPSADLEVPLYNSDGNDQIKESSHTSRFAEVMKTIVQVTPSPSVSKASLALSQFSINIMKILQMKQGNIVVSPYSIATVLAILQQGATGLTQQQITNALLLAPSEAADGYRELIKTLLKRDSLNIFKSANGMFLSNEFEINPVFKRVAVNDFNSEVATLKFSRPEQATAKINNWVSRNTDNKINDIIKQGTLSENVQLALVNAVYFKGVWQEKFNPAMTIIGDFNLPNGIKKSVHYMRAQADTKYGIDPSIRSQIVVIPFERNEYSLVIILPSINSSVSEVLSSLTPERLLAYQNLNLEEVHMVLPKFDVKVDSDLVPVLQQLGISNIFSPFAELSGLSSNPRTLLQVTNALHSAVLSIDEEGAVGGAATISAAVTLSADGEEYFIASRPFVAIVWNNRAAVPLFVAKIEDPIE